jgi:RNA polymerase sigma factor (sigma-70 family)
MKMTEITQSDDALLKHWLATRSEAAFRTLVGRYAGLVHMAAMRTCGDASIAAEASQNTFITLAEKAGTLASRKSLAGWLHLTAVMQAKNLHRKQLRDSRKIERFHLQMDPPTPEQAAIDWGRLSPLLDEALSTLPAKDRDALLLRFYRSLSIQDVAATLGIAHAAAQKRVNRATERLRRIFERKGVRTSGALSAVMAAGFRTDAQAAPALIDTLTSKALTASAAGTTATLTTTTIIILMKKKATIAAGTLLLLTGVTTAILLNEREKTTTAASIADHSPESHQAGNEAEDSRSAASRKRQPVENPELVAKYGANRTALSRKISRELTGILESQLKKSEGLLTDIREDDTRGSNFSVELAIGRDLTINLKLSDAQLEAAKQPYLDHAIPGLARSKAIIESLKEDPAVLMEYLLASDASARGTGDPAELAAMQKRINDTLAGSDEVGKSIGEMGIVTIPSGPFANPRFVTAFRPLLEPNQVEQLDARLEKVASRIPAPPKAVELDKMHLAASSVAKMMNSWDKMTEDLGKMFEKAEDAE